MSSDIAALQREIDALKKENRVLNRKMKEIEYLVSSYEQYAVFQKSIYESIKKQKNEQDIYLRMMFSSTPNLVLILDAAKTYVLGTKKPLRQFGIDVDALTGKNFAAIFEPIMPQVWVQEFDKTLQRALTTGEPIQYAKQIITIQGKKYCYKINIIPFWDTDERIIGVMFVMHDETDLHEMVIAAESSNRAKTAFLAKMSHEIRTPMNAIAGMAELILREHTAPLVREHVMNIKQASGNLMAIINDILDFSKIESGKLEIVEDEYRFASLINDVISTIRPRIIDKQIFFVTNVDCNIPNSLIGDEIRIRQILLNLLSNAFKYCEQGFISVRAGYEQCGDGSVIVIFDIEDSGIGIKPEDYDKLFNDFTQLDKVTNKDVEGTGLGLVITKNLCEAMGGKIFVKSIYGKGSTFTVRIPQKVKVYEKFATVNNASDINILIYETREAYSNSIVRSIDNLGIKSKLVSNQSQFLEELANNKYSHVFVSSFLSESAEKVIGNLKVDAAIVLITEYGENAINKKNVRTLDMPAHAMSIANILSGVSANVYAENPLGCVRFIAPAARALLVDDLTTNLRVAEGLMLPYRMQIDICRSGREAIELVCNNKYDIVFMDHMMPDMDGIEATLKIRELASGNDGEYYKNLPIIALTANAIAGVKEMFQQNGFSDFLAKPIEMLKLNAILETWLPKDKLEPYTASNREQDIPVFEIPGVDVRAGIYMTGGNEANYLRVLSAFYRDGAEKIEQLHEYCQKGNMKQYAACTHAVKGASASIGAAKLSSLAKALELAAKNEDTEYIRKNNGMLLDEFKALLNNIGYIASVSNRCKNIAGSGDALQITEYIARLKDALLSFDIETADAILTELHYEDWGEKTNHALERVADKILICEYEQALDIIEGLSIDNGRAFPKYDPMA